MKNKISLSLRHSVKNNFQRQMYSNQNAHALSIIIFSANPLRSRLLYKATRAGLREDKNIADSRSIHSAPEKLAHESV